MIVIFVEFIDQLIDYPINLANLSKYVNYCICIQAHLFFWL